MSTPPAAATLTGAKEIVMACVNAIVREDFDMARAFVADGMQFEGVLGSRNGADAYFDDMKKMKLKYRVQRTFAEGDDVCLLYDLDMGGTEIFCCGWYHLTNNKIDHLRVVFDPRPVMDKKK